MPPCRPANDDYFLLVDHDPSASDNSLQLCLRPGIGIAYVLDSTINEVDLRAQPVIDANGQHVVGEKVGSLIGSDRLPGKRHVSPAMDHKRYKRTIRVSIYNSMRY